MTETSPPKSSNGDACDRDDSKIFSFLAVALLLALIMGMAGSVDVRTLKAQFDKRTGIICGFVCQFLIMPFIGFMIIKAGRPEKHVALTLMVLVSSSGGAYSNWWCSLFNVDLALSVAMTAASTAVCAIMLPANVLFYASILFDTDVHIPWGELVQSIAAVFVGIVAGVMLTTWKPHWKRCMNLLGNCSGVSLIALTAVSSLFKKRQGKQEAGTPPWGKDTSFYLLVITPFVIALIASLLISSLPCLHLRRPERVAITVEVCYQNVGIASTVAISAFCDSPSIMSDAVAVPLVYGLTEAAFLALFCLVAWKAGWTYAPKNLGIAAVILGDFQPVVVNMPARSSASVAPADALEHSNLAAMFEISDAGANAPGVSTSYGRSLSGAISPQVGVDLPTKAKSAP